MNNFRPTEITELLQRIHQYSSWQVLAIGVVHPDCVLLHIELFIAWETEMWQPMGSASLVLFGSIGMALSYNEHQ